MRMPTPDRRDFSSRRSLLAALVILGAGCVLSIIAVTSHKAADAPTALELAAVGLSGIGLVAAVLGFRAVGRDALTRAAIDRERRASEQKYAGILSIAADAIITIDEAQRVVHFNRGAEEIFGWPESEMLGQPLDRLIPARFRTRHSGHIGSFRDAREVARRMGERQEIFGARRSGEEFPAEASISRLELGGRCLLTVVLRDITERKRQQDDQQFLVGAGATLSASLDYESTLRSVAHLAIPYLADCCILDVGDPVRGLRRVASVHEDPAITRQLRALETRRVTDPAWPLPVATALETGEPVVRDALPADWWRTDRADMATQQEIGSLGITGMMTVPLVARNRTLGTLTLLATGAGGRYGPDQHGLVEALVRLGALAIDNAFLYQSAQHAAAARDEILGVVSHDLRNPLSAIAMCARVLVNAPPGEAADQRELVTAILESTDLMHRLIQDLLDVSMIESGHLAIRRQPEALPELVERVLAMMRDAARERNVVLRTALAPALPRVNVDAGRVVQVLANLVANAVKFTESGGVITVSAAVGMSEVVVDVRDTGIGIPPEDLPHIFDRYWHARRSARTAGTGLGLAISRGIVEAHGGRLWVESAEGQGSTFRFSLPVVPIAPLRAMTLEPVRDATPS
jgi:PAS domain S-box-containing protein